MKFQCITCSGTYSDTQPDGTPYFHGCPSETVQPAVFDATGKVTVAEVRTPLANRRDERIKPGLIIQDGKVYREVADPTHDKPPTLDPAVVEIISQGKGRTQIA